MTDLEATQAIYDVVNDGWTATPVVYGAGKYSPASPSTSWIRVSVKREGTKGHTIGPGGRVTRLGRVFAQVFAIPLAGKDSGEGAAVALAQAFRALFELQSLPVTGEPVHFLEGSVREVGPDGPHYHVNADVAFWFHDTAPT